MTSELSGKTALITGGSRGLGQAIAEKLAAAGAMVAVNYATNSETAAATVQRIEKRGGQAFAIKALVNNIGGGEYATILDVTEQSYDQTMSNNVRSAFFLTKALYHRLNDNGRVINLSSVGVRLTDPGIIVYTMAKAALEAFTRVMAKELGARGITVNSVGPGFTAGETNAHVVEDPVMSKRVIDDTALRRFGQPEDIADIVYVLASPLGRWITAQNIDASGGFKL
jgi:NAD(P)-dependent dehydrogenase (short-subunit alcohol dehydrogenase family)